MGKLILYIAISQDGFIADKNGGVDWLPQPKDDTELTIMGYADLMSRIDTILMGSASYKQILGFGEWGWPNKQTYVFTSQPIESKIESVMIIKHELVKFVSRLKSLPSEKDIWLLGGASLAKSCAKEGFIDEIILTIIPQILHEGIPLGLNFNDFDFIEEKLLMDGIVQKNYLRKK